MKRASHLIVVLVLTVLSFGQSQTQPLTDDEILAERQFRGGISYMAIAQWRHAIERFQACLKANPYHRSAWNDLGLANLYLGDLESAEKAFKRAIDVNPKEIGRAHV